MVHARTVVFSWVELAEQVRPVCDDIVNVECTRDGVIERPVEALQLGRVILRDGQKVPRHVERLKRKGLL